VYQSPPALTAANGFMGAPFGGVSRASTIEDGCKEIPSLVSASKL
jgi:hypothetical protein